MKLKLKSKMKRSHGFKINLLNNIYSVHFEYPAEKVIKCFINDEASGMAFSGIAVCKDPDIYDRNTGETISFTKAENKLINFYEKTMRKDMKIINDWFKNIHLNVSQLRHKFLNIITK